MIRNRPTLATSPLHGVALDCVEAGVGAALPAAVVAESVSVDGDTLRIDGATYDLGAVDRVIVIGGGNAAGRLAAAIEGVLGDRIDDGVVVTDAPGDTDRVEQVAGSHPIPDEAARDGARRVRALAEEADAETLVLALITGGGSALLPAPAEGVDLSALQAVTDALVTSGASIDEINAVRKHLSSLKGGQLARAAAPATVVGLVLSDVVGNRLDVVASGPISPDESTYAEALAVLDGYPVDAPASVRDRLSSGAAGDLPETPGPDDPAFDGVATHVLADGLTALRAAADAAAERGFDPLVLSARIRGEAQPAATTHVGIAEEIAATGTPIEPPAVVLSGGETTVTVSGDGRGGPNQEFALAAARELAAGGVCVAAVDTDGIDGATDVAGAIATRETAEPAEAAREALAEHDVYPFLAARDAVIDTGPTGTNVNDLRVLVIGE